MKPQISLALLLGMGTLVGCGQDESQARTLRFAETKGEGPGKPARPPAPPDEGELPDTEEPAAPTAETICASDLRIPSVAALEAETTLSNLVLDGLGHYRFRRDTAWYEQWSVGIEVAAEGQVSPDRVKALWCEALEHWRRLVPPPAMSPRS